MSSIGPEGRALVEQHLLAVHVSGERVAQKVFLPLSLCVVQDDCFQILRISKREKLDEAARMVVNTMTNRLYTVYII